MTAGIGGTSGWDPKDWLGLVSALGTIVALGVSYAVSNRTLKASRYATDAAIWQKANEAELKAIQDQLDNFFAPLMQRSDLNSMLSRDLRDRQPNSTKFILLESLMNPAWRKALPSGEAALVGELVANAKDIRAFIGDHGAVNEKLIPYLARASAHYRILELADTGALGDDPEPWKAYVYPRVVDQVLRLEMDRLKRRAILLRENPGKAPPMPEELVIPKDLDLQPWVDPPREARPGLTAPLDGPA